MGGTDKDDECQDLSNILYLVYLVLCSLSLLVLLCNQHDIGIDLRHARTLETRLGGTHLISLSPITKMKYKPAGA